MTRRLPLIAQSLNLALFEALSGPQDRTRSPARRNPEKQRYQPRRFRPMPGEATDAVHEAT